MHIVDLLLKQQALAISKQDKLDGPNLNKLAYLINSSDLHVVLVGTGTPVIVENRQGPCTAIVGGGHFFLVDCGPGSYRSCALMGLPVGRLDAVLLTHFHSDHIGDLGFHLLDYFVVFILSNILLVSVVLSLLLFL
jgi:hypothetical protein